jgi:hypothetical protein
VVLDAFGRQQQRFDMLFMLHHAVQGHLEEEAVWLITYVWMCRELQRETGFVASKSVFIHIELEYDSVFHPFSVPSSIMSSSAMNRYWIPHIDIHKKVITQELQYHLGPQATVRPYTLEVWALILVRMPC